MRRRLGASLNAIKEAKTALDRLISERALKSKMFMLEAVRPIAEHAPVKALQGAISGGEKERADHALLAAAHNMKRFAEAEREISPYSYLQYA